MNKLITILMIFVLFLTPMTILAQEVSEVPNPNEPLVEDIPLEDEPVYVDEFVGEIEEPQCVDNLASFCYAAFRYTECVDGFWQVHTPKIGLCDVQCFEDSDCSENQVCQTDILKCVVVEDEPEEPQCTNEVPFCYAAFRFTECVDGQWSVHTPKIGLCDVQCFEDSDCNSGLVCYTDIHKCVIVEDEPEADPREQLCKDTNGTWITNETTPSNVEEARCDCSQISPGKWKWNSVEGCKVVIQEAEPIYPIDDEPEDDSNNDNGNSGTYTSSSAIRLHYPEEVFEETPLEELASEEIVEETTEEPQGFFNAITGFLADYGSLANENGNFYLYPLAVLLCVGIVVFVAREY